MKISEELYVALQKDKELNNIKGDIFVHFPNIKNIYKYLNSIENNQVMKNYDYWGLERPFGFHSLKNKK